MRVGALQIVSDAGLYIAAARGYFQQVVNVEFTSFRSLQEQIPLLATDKLDAGGAVDAGLFNAIARDVPLKIVADKGSNLSPEFTSQALVIRKDLIDSGRFKDYPDLAGATSASPAARAASSRTWISPRSAAASPSTIYRPPCWPSPT